MKIGIISDTHDFLDPKVAGLFKGVEHILHGGDIGMPALLLELEFIAPVTAVAGNTDDPALGYRLTQVVKLANHKFLIHHIIDPYELRDELAAQIARDRPEVVVFGHTHKPFCKLIDGVLFLNPGYAGKQRFNLPRTVALLRCEEKSIRHEFISL